MTDHETLAKAVTDIKRVLDINTRLNYENKFLASRVRTLEKLVSEYEARALDYQKNQLLLTTTIEGAKEVGEKLRKSIIDALNNWNDKLRDYHERETEQSNCCDKSFYDEKEQERDNAHASRREMIETIEEALTPREKV